MVEIFSSDPWHRQTPFLCGFPKELMNNRFTTLPDLTVRSCPPPLEYILRRTLFCIPIPRLSWFYSTATPPELHNVAKVTSWHSRMFWGSKLVPLDTISIWNLGPHDHLTDPSRLSARTIVLHLNFFHFDNNYFLKLLIQLPLTWPIQAQRWNLGSDTRM